MGRGIFYHGQLGMLNECLYRYMFSTKYIAFIDADERIVPKQDYTWTELINHLNQNLSKKVRSKTCGFSFTHVLFNRKWPDDKESPLNQNSSKRIVTLVKTRREISTDRQRAKVIANPRMVDLMGVHRVLASFEGRSKQYSVYPSVAAMHH